MNANRVSRVSGVNGVGGAEGVSVAGVVGVASEVGEVGFSERDITTLYDALGRCSGSDIARALLSPACGKGGCGVSAEGPSVGLASRRASSMMSLLMRLDPNLEASSEVLLPWKPAHVARLSGMSWPDALGTRIAFPSDVSPLQKHRLLANLLLAMSYL